MERLKCYCIADSFLALTDDPSLDYRLSIIRRQSGLDSRASLFVISPVPQAEVQKFVASLQIELYESAIDYYREHGRRVRRKRSRVPTSTVSRPIGGSATSAPTLSGAAWSVSRSLVFQAAGLTLPFDLLTGSLRIQNGSLCRV